MKSRETKRGILRGEQRRRKRKRKMRRRGRSKQRMFMNGNEGERAKLIYVSLNEC